MEPQSRDSVVRALDAARAAKDDVAVGQLTAYLEEFDRRQRISDIAAQPGGRYDVANASAVNPAGEQLLEAVKGAGVRGGAQAIGTAIGAAPPLVAISGGLSPRIGGAGGAVLGELIEGMRTGQRPTAGQVAGSAAAGFLMAPPTQVVSRGAILTRSAAAPEIPESLLRTSLKEATSNVAAENIESLVDRGELSPAASQVVAGVFGAGGAVTGRALSTGKRAKMAQEEMLTAKAIVRTVDDALSEGLLLDPSLANPTAVNRGLVSAAGRSNLQNELSRKNIDTATKLSALEIGLDPSANSLDWLTLRTQRDAIAQPYRNASELSPLAKKAFDKMQEERSNWREALKSASRETDYKKKKQINEEAQRHLEASKSAERVLEKVAVSSGNPGLVDEIRDARQKLAKWYVVDAALNADSGKIDPTIIAAIHDKNRELLTGKLRTIGATANAFPQVMSPFEQSANIAEQGVRGIYISAAAGAGHTLYGTPGAVAAGAAMASSPIPLKKLLESNWWQSVMAHPSYDLKQPDRVAEFFRYAVDAYGRHPAMMEDAKDKKK